MTVEIRVPELGESILEATVSRWFKQAGERVEVGEALVELETDKVNLEVGAERAGVLKRIAHQEGEDVRVGDVLGEIEPLAEGAPVAESATPTSAVEKVPTNRDQKRPTLKVPEEKASAPPAEKMGLPTDFATPVAKRLARQQGIDLSKVAGSGPGGRVTKDDLVAFQEAARAPEGVEMTTEAPPAVRPAQPAAPESPPVAEELFPRREERVKMSRRRRTIARRLVEVQQTTAMLTTFNEVDMSAVMELRRRQESFQARHGVKLGITSFFVKASIGALKAFPRLNAELDGDEMILKHYYDIGVAVGSEEGLVVPVLRDADRLTMAEIELQIKDFARKAEEGSLSLEDLRGGTFTITNGGVFGSLLSTPILNPPQVGILGLHKIENRPVAQGNELVIRAMMYLALSYDHRIVDGREAVQFLVRIKELIEDPEMLFLES